MLVGQAQKEFFVNQSLAVVDALMGRAVAGIFPAPPASVPEGTCYLVGPGATGAWAGRENQLALAIGGDWHFVVPESGWQFFDRGRGQWVHFDGAWQAADLPAAANGGAVIDAEARALLAQIIDALAKLGLVAVHPA